MKSFILLFVSFLIGSNVVQGQDVAVSYPKEGEVILDHTFTDLMNYPKKTFSINGNRGKWLVLDFWSKNCGACIASFPKMNQLYEQYADKVMILAVGLYRNYGDKVSNETVTKNIYKSKIDRYHITMPGSFDSIAGEKFDISGVPAIFVINPEGIIVAKTTSLDSSQLAAFINGQVPRYRRSYSAHEKRNSNYDVKLPMLTSGDMSNGGVDTMFISRSILARWNSSMMENWVAGWSDQPGINGKPKPGFAEAIGTTLTGLFHIGYTGLENWAMGDSLYNKLGRGLVVETKDSMGFRKEVENKYSYSITLPASTTSPDRLRKALLDELHRAFGIQSRIKEREIEVYKLIVIDKRKVEEMKSKGGESKIALASNRLGVSLRNMPFNKFLEVSRMEQGIKEMYDFNLDITPPVIDSTNINFNVDFDFTADPRDFKEVRDVLRQHGLDVVKGKAILPCIVIEDMN